MAQLKDTSISGVLSISKGMIRNNMKGLVIGTSGTTSYTVVGKAGYTDTLDITTNVLNSGSSYTDKVYLDGTYIAAISSPLNRTFSSSTIRVKCYCSAHGPADSTDTTGPVQINIKGPTGNVVSRSEQRITLGPHNASSDITINLSAAECVSLFRFNW